MIKLFDYQKELINDVKEGKSVVCNWARGGGKTFMLAKLLLEVKPTEVLYVTLKLNGLKEISDKLDEIFVSEKECYKNVLKYSSSKEKIELEFSSGEKVTVATDKSMLSDVEYVFYNDDEPFLQSDFQNKFVIMTTQNNYDRSLQRNYKKHNCKISEVDMYDLVKLGLYDVGFIRENSSDKHFFEEWAILSKAPEDDKLSLNDFKLQAFQRLMKQFLSTSDTKDTVLTRKNIIEMIKDLDSLGK